MTSIPNKAIETAASAASLSMEKSSCLQIENQATSIQSEILPNIANSHDPLISDMSDTSKFLHDSKINIKLPGENNVSYMKSSQPLNLLPSSFIEHIYKEEGPIEGSTGHLILENSEGFS